MVTLRDVLNTPGLGLHLLSGEASLDREIRWAHVSELDDPTPWLEGGELLLTTGLNASWGYASASEYCKRLADAGVIALGVSTGSGMAHDAVSSELIAAAADNDFALIDVPTRTPLQAVVRAVADAINLEFTEPLKSTVEIQRQLIEAAASSDGLTRALQRLHDSAGLQCVVYDLRLKEIAHGAPSLPGLSPELRRQIRKRTLGEVRGAMTWQDREDTLIVLPLGAGAALRGVLAVWQRNRANPHERSLIKLAVPILSLLLDLRYAAEAPNRHHRSLAFDMMISTKGSRERIERALTQAGIEVDRVQFFTARLKSASQFRRFVAGLAELAVDVLIRRDGEDVVGVLCAPHRDLMENLQALVHEVDGIAVGLGNDVTIDAAELSYQQAHRALTIAKSRDGGLVALPAYNSYVALALMGERAEQRVFSDTVLEVLDVHDRTNPRQPLLPALRAFFDTIGSIEQAASVLGVHRHTMRARIAKISDLTDHDLGDPREYLELWLAIELRRLAPDHN